MAAKLDKYYKVLYLFVCVCVATEAVGQAGERVLAEARKDVGLFEGRSNTGETQKFGRYWNAKNPKAGLVLNSPYCGLAVWYWYMKAGLNPNVGYAPRAIDWKNGCKDARPFFGMTIGELERIPKAAAVVYRVNRRQGYGNHVGIFSCAIMTDIYTIEGNTSTARSVKKYSKKGEGVFMLKTSVNGKTIRPMWWCDCVKQSTSL